MKRGSSGQGRSVAIVECDCPRELHCNRCYEMLRGQLSGTAACRGDRWAITVAKTYRSREPWPPYEGKCAEIADRWVRDLSEDPRLRDALARTCVEYAARWWAKVDWADLDRSMGRGWKRLP